ncbi:DUF1327 domain-containing protein, partial [Escherichia coli]|nr:DUF1327 domain-containing protein [Escherichia coli]
FYEAEAKKQAKQFFMDIAAALCEGDEQSQEKCLCSEERYTIQINNAYNTILSEKDDIESRIEKLSALMHSDDEKKRRDEQYVAFYDYCRKVMSRNLAECFRIQKNRESSANGEILDNFLKGTHLASDCFIAHSFGGFHEAIKHDVERSPGILCSIPVSIEIDTNTITGELVTAGVGVFRHEGNDAKGSFTKIGPFFLKVER